MSFNISFKLTILCLLLVVFTSVSLFYFGDRENQKALKEQLLTELLDTSAEGIKSIDRFLQERLTDIRSVAKDPVLLYSVEPKAIEKRLKELEELNPLYYSYSFFSQDRIRVADSKGLSVGKQHSLTKYWIPLTSGERTVVMDISKSESVGQPVIHFASSVISEDGVVVGYVVARVLITRLYEVFASHEEGGLWGSEKLKVDLMTKEGLLLYSNHQADGVLVDTYYGFPMVRQMLKEEERSVEMNEMLFLVAEEKGYLDFKGNDWSMVVALPLKEAYKPLEAVRRKMLYILVPIFLVAVLLSILSAKYFSRPIQRLSLAADRIGHGEFDTPIDVQRRGDELEVLADNLGVMAGNLRKREEQQLSFQKELELLNGDLNDKLTQIQDQKEEIASQNSALEYAFEELDKRNKQQTASINYAKRIQEAMLPKEEDLTHYFEGSYVYFKPRDIVSGDFYWYEKVEKDGEDYLIVAAADCTGHGVPGAIMAMLGSNLLTNIICYGGFTDPAEVLKRLNRDIRTELHQDREESHDGMEIAICRINLNTLELAFASAGRPLYMFSKGELTRVKSGKAHIGGGKLFQERRSPENLDTRYFQLEKGDAIYMFSDGFKDQIGGKHQRVFSSKRMREMLNSIHDKTVSEQIQHLDKYFADWKGSLPQTDDILMVCLNF